MTKIFNKNDVVYYFGINPYGIKKLIIKGNEIIKSPCHFLILDNDSKMLHAQIFSDKKDCINESKETIKQYERQELILINKKYNDDMDNLEKELIIMNESLDDKDEQ